MSSKSEFRVIGLGSCGSVFEVPGTELACKKGSDEKAIWLDFCQTNAVHNANKDVRNLLQRIFPNATMPMTPLCQVFNVADSDHFWLHDLDRFPENHRTRQAIFTVDRVPPLPEAMREALIDAFFDDDDVEDAKKDAENKDCLARVYLGERSKPDDEFDSLRNFPLKLDMLEEISIYSIIDLAMEMAIGLATVHWQAQLDGMDMEFVLGSAASGDDDRPAGYADLSQPPHDVDVVNFKRRPIHMWILDFDKARKFEMSEKDVKTKLVPAFLGNDPYYPRPHMDEELWNCFRVAYLKASIAILRARGVENKRVLNLPGRFMEEVMKVEKANEGWNAEENIIFG